MFSGKNVLVAGSSGFIGANLMHRLLPLGANIRATVHKKDIARIADERVEYITCDLTQIADCHRVVRDMDYVFMCAANTSGAAVIQNTPLVHVTPNVIMNAQMLEAAYLAKVKKFVGISSGTIYPPRGDRPMREDEMFNGDPFGKYFPVGWMKRYMEVLCRMYSEMLSNPMATVVLRPSNVYGPHDDFDFATSHVTAALIRKVVERHDPLVVWGTGDNIRDLLYIDDFIDAMLLAVEKIETYDPINIASGKGYSVREILLAILEVDGYTNARIEFDSSKPSMIPIMLLDTAKAERTLGFKAKITLKEGIRKTIDWYRSTLPSL
jgi:GDP-L-fucose synthase